MGDSERASARVGGARVLTKREQFAEALREAQGDNWKLFVRRPGELEKQVLPLTVEAFLDAVGSYPITNAFYEIRWQRQPRSGRLHAHSTDDSANEPPDLETDDDFAI